MSKTGWSSSLVRFLASIGNPSLASESISIRIDSLDPEQKRMMPSYVDDSSRRPPRIGRRTASIGDAEKRRWSEGVSGLARLACLLAAVAAVTTCQSVARGVDAPARPNVLVILADDLGFSDVGAFGGEIDTPHLDRLAAGGLRFTQGYNTARCWPTRAALLTGYYPQAIGRDALPGGKGGGNGTRPAWARLLPERLTAAGYRSYHSGKWHIDGDPRAQGFARSLDVIGAGQSNYFDPRGVTDDGRPIPAAADFYTTTAIGDHAVSCLAEHARDHAGVPFFHYVAFTAPHFPVQAPADVIAKYRERYLAGWDAVRATRAGRLRASGIVTTAPADPEPEVGPPYQPKPQILAQLGPGEVDRPCLWDSLTAEQRRFQATKMAIHAAMVDVMDREIGRLLAQLEVMQALENTLIVFLSDNGASAEIMIRGEGHDPAAPPGSRESFLCLGPGWSSCANTPFRRHKTWVHEGGIATPWIVHWPAGIAASGELRRQPVHAIDLVPTVLEVAEVREQEGQSAPPLQGRSFAGALSSAAAAPAHESLWWCHEGHRAVRMGDWKLVAARGEPWELYDLAVDRCETTDLAASEPDRVAGLEQEWNRVAAECRGLAQTESQRAGRSMAAPAKAAGLTEPSSPARPNIVVIMGDDMGYSDVGCFGGEIPTPHLDSLAAGGVRFTNFYNAARCCPTRASLLTGLYPHQAGIGHMVEDLGTPAYRGNLGRDTVTIAEALRPAGYRSYMAGKWHVTPGRPVERMTAHRDNWPRERGFDRFYGTIRGSGSFWDPSGLVREREFISPFADPEYRPEDYYYTDAITDHAVRYVRDHAREHPTQPFFLYLAYTAAHWPMHAPEAEIARHRGRYDAGYEAVRRARWEKQKRLGLADDTWHWTPTVADFSQTSDPAFETRCMEVYAAMVAIMDRGIGRLVEELEATGQFENTLILYLQDNGACAETNGRKGRGVARAATPTLPPLKAETVQFENKPPQTRDGWPVRQGIGVMPGASDTYVAYGEAWANVSNTPFREYKHWVHEGGIASPLIAHWPAAIRGPVAGAVCREPTHLIDIMATAVDLAAAEYPQALAGRAIQSLEGRSLRPLLAEPTAAFPGDPRTLFWEHEGNRAVRDGRWKLVAKHERPWELYDLATDRTEVRDLAASQPKRVAEMSAAWQQWADRVGVEPWTYEITAGSGASPTTKIRP